MTSGSGCCRRSKESAISQHPRRVKAKSLQPKYHQSPLAEVAEVLEVQIVKAADLLHNACAPANAGAVDTMGTV